MSRRHTALLLVLAACLMLLPGCSGKPVQQGMQTVEGLTFLVSSVTRGDEVAVTVTMTNGTGEALYLRASELEEDGGSPVAAYLEMALGECESDLAGRRDNGQVRWLALDARESYSETRVFTGSLPATLTVTVESAPSYSGEFTETAVEMALK